MGQERLPLGNATQITSEDSIGDLKTVKGKASVQWIGAGDLLFFEAEGPGARIDLPLDIPSTGRYEVLARIAQAPDYGNYVAMLDGKAMNLDNREAQTSELPATGPAVLQNYLPVLYVAAEHPLGWLQLEKVAHAELRLPGPGWAVGGILFGDQRSGRGADSGGGGPDGASAADGGCAHVSAEPVYRGRTLVEYRRRLAGTREASRAGVLRSIRVVSRKTGRRVHRK